MWILIYNKFKLIKTNVYIKKNRYACVRVFDWYKRKRTESNLLKIKHSLRARWIHTNSTNTVRSISRIGEINEMDSLEQRFDSSHGGHALMATSKCLLSSTVRGAIEMWFRLSFNNMPLGEHGVGWLDSHLTFNPIGSFSELTFVYCHHKNEKAKRVNQPQQFGLVAWGWLAQVDIVQFSASNCSFLGWKRHCELVLYAWRGNFVRAAIYKRLTLHRNMAAVARSTSQANQSRANQPHFPLSSFEIGSSSYNKQTEKVCQQPDNKANLLLTRPKRAA